MKRIRYGVAMSLDGYIAGPNGEADWIVSDPEVNFAEIWAQFDTLLMGRRTYDAAKARLGETALQGVKTIVVSRTLRHADHPKVTIFSDLNRDWIEELRAQGGKDIWLMGGGELTRDFLRDDLVDELHLGVVPVLIGEGIPAFPSGFPERKFTLVENNFYSKGLIALRYERRKGRKK